MGFVCGVNKLVADKSDFSREWKVRNASGAPKACLYRLRFWSLSHDVSIQVDFAHMNIVIWFFHIARFFPFLVIETTCFLVWKVLLFLVNLYKNTITLFFRFIQSKQISTIRWHCKITTFFQFLRKLFKNQTFYFLKTYEKLIMSKDYCIAHHVDKIIFVPDCRYHNLLIKDIKDLLQILDAFCFTYQHVGCLYTLFR